MRSNKAITKVWGIIVCSLIPSIGFAADTKLPLEDFAALPMIEFPAVSPDGSRVATIINGKDGPEIAVSDFGGNPLQTIAQLGFGHFKAEEVDRVVDLRWAGEDMLFMSVVDVVANQGNNRTAVNNDNLDTVARNRVSVATGTGIRGRRMFVYKMEAEVLSPVWRQSEKANIGAFTPVMRDFGRIISYIPDDPEEILVELYSPEDRAHSVFRVDIAKNNWKKVLQNKYPIDQWIADPSGRVQFGVQLGPETKTIWYSPNGKKKFEPIMELPVADDETFEPIVANDGIAIVISDHETGYRAVWTYDIEKREFGNRLFAIEGIDVASVTLTDDGTQLRSVTYIDQFPTTEYFLETDMQRSRIIAQSFRDYHPTIAAESNSGQQMLVSLSRDDVPTKYFWVDLAKNAAGPWYGTYPNLDGKPMAKKQLVEFKGRDGMQLHGYLTVPERADGKKPPVVIYPHDGPDSRDDMRFDPMVQFLANRGYAVLQPNYRGSRGFGTEFLRSGYREWGHAMQDDLVAAADWLDSVDSVDASNKCILGFRYAGFAAITAAHRRQMQVDCAISVAAPYSLYRVTFKEYRQKFDADDRRRYEFKPDHSSDANGTSVLKNFWDTPAVIGNPVDGDDKDMILAVSPAENIDEINVPLLVMHGSHDTYVDINHAKAFEREATRANKPLEYVQLEHGSHFINGHKDRVAMYTEVEKFLGKYLN